MLRRLLRNVGQGAPAGPAEDNPLLAYARSPRCERVMIKWLHYFDVYHRHLSRLRGQAITFIEIGVFNGGSLPMWRDYFGPQAHIVGVDINPGCARYAEPGIDVVIGDQGDRGFLRELRDRYPGAAALLDDGGHTMQQQIATFEELYPSLDPAGVYLCEDLHTSYLAPFGGGYRRPGTFVEMGKSLVDRLNAAHVGDDGAGPDAFTVSTDSLHFYDSMLVIERRARAAPEQVTFGRLADFHGVPPPPPGA
ncbi:MAG: hypothetical protein JNM90_20170 [Burkholderiales bacterium]|nr:hypothetical protein [Burkholderiales bacterium]